MIAPDPICIMKVELLISDDNYVPKQCCDWLDADGYLLSHSAWPCLETARLVQVEDSDNEQRNSPVHQQPLSPRRGTTGPCPFTLP